MHVIGFVSATIFNVQMSPNLCEQYVMTSYLETVLAVVYFCRYR